ncbi:hypothetical protein BJV82DRAFT_626477 [Fennellomyces sp. T-0311]|nr:hypothetical protein BJV82DRAFT_626477 [Fennellomyces sp. T-0311]
MHMWSIVKWFSIPYFIILVLNTDSHVIGISQGAVYSQWNSYPFFVAFTQPLVCGGVLISLDPAWVLTANHCLPTAGEIAAKVFSINKSFAIHLRILPWFSSPRVYERVIQLPLPAKVGGLLMQCFWESVIIQLLRQNKRILKPHASYNRPIVPSQAHHKVHC